MSTEDRGLLCDTVVPWRALLSLCNTHTPSYWFVPPTGTPMISLVIQLSYLLYRRFMCQGLSSLSVMYSFDCLTVSIMIVSVTITSPVRGVWLYLTGFLVENTFARGNKSGFRIFEYVRGHSLQALLTAMITVHPRLENTIE